MLTTAVRGLLAGAALTLVLSATPAVAERALSLPAPTGGTPVGATTLHLKDTSRPDTWVPSVPYRELMVSVFYPATSARGPKKQFMTRAEAQALLADGGLTDVPPEVVSTTRTHAVVDARPAGRRHSAPLVVLSPGFKKNRGTLTSWAEEVVSHGYVVAVVDHTYENLGTSFPGGRVAECAACGAYDDAFWRKLATGRATDVSFVLDQLTGPRPAWSGANLIDPARVAMAGHSVGGASAAQAMLADQRIKAGIDVDGTTDVRLPESGLSRPFMFLGRANTYTPGTGDEARSWELDWPRLTGWKRWLTVAGMEHPSFTDVGLIADQLGLDFGADTPAARGNAITRAYVLAFVDQHLRGRSQPLLDQPSSRYPEVSLVRSSTPYLPAPTGDHPVGSSSLYLKDTSRQDPWVPSVPYRELMVSVFYPATSAKGTRARYVTPAESAAMLADTGLDVPPDVLSTMRTNSVAGSPPAGRGLPLVVLSPGYTKPRATLTALAEDLASHGYVVAVVGHTYENVATSFPDGRLVGCASCEVPHDDAFWRSWSWVGRWTCRSCWTS